MVNHQENAAQAIGNEPLAIIGMNCQFPGIGADVETVEALHAMLMQKKTPIKEVPKERWDIEAYHAKDRKKADKMVSRKGGFLENVALFDAAFFKISAAKAKQIDPQQRLFLEVALRALNDANIPCKSLSDSATGVFCGMSTHEYSQLNYKDCIKFNAHTSIGVANSAAAGRLSHFLNLKGPSVVVDTACSSSLSALYLASTALRARQCSMAIVGGVHLGLCPESWIGLSKAGLLSAKGQCSSFDAEADGYVRSEGCAVVVVKRLNDALRDNDKIYAVIKSIVMNQDGGGHSFAAPNLKAQIALHEAALKEAYLKARDIDYIEANGIGTAVGDAVEFNAIQHIHRNQHPNKPLIIGALKSNLGHTVSAAGLASLLKALCALKHETIPPNLHYLLPNAAIGLQTAATLLPDEAIPFTREPNKKRYVQVCNFSVTGTNACVILEEAPASYPRPLPMKSDPCNCFVVSANSEPSLKRMLSDYVYFLQQTAADFHDICCTLLNCRDQFKYRCAFLVQDKEAVIKKITAKDYEIFKVNVTEELATITCDARQIHAAFLQGKTIHVDAPFNKIDLPLYPFDRKPYWHEPRRPNAHSHWLDELQSQAKEGQIEIIKSKLTASIQTLLKKEELDVFQDLQSLGLTSVQLSALDAIFHEMFLPRFNIPFSLNQSASYLSVDKLARQLQQLLAPPPVHRQPVVHVLNAEPIAIIGMSCRLPKAANIAQFLSLLEQGESGMDDIPLERWDNEKFYDPDPNALGRLYVRQMGLIDHVKHFDAEFFNISPREAKLMSPQLRIFMETSYHALEDANLSLDAVKDSKTGVFVGVGTNEYPRILAYQGVTLEELNIYFATGNVLNALAGRVAYAFDFHGPIQAIDTACSSSMTAIHNACLSLQAGDCDMALAGGVNIILSPDSNITLCKARMLSPESRCKTFSEDADGYGRSEGCGILVLKRLSTAIRDNDNILAVIKGTAANSDGKSGGFTVPNGTAQEEVIRSALAKSRLLPGDIDFIEAHGTGTPLADPIEVNALGKIFSESHSDEHPLYISSVKTNLGHSESASGVTSVIKTVLSLQTKQLFKHLNFKKLNPQINLKHMAIPLETQAWPKEQGLRCAGVSSFGFSGANAHVIVQEMPGKIKEGRSLPAESLLVISAKSRDSLELMLASYQKYLSQTEHEFADICYTAATCRSHFLFRVAIKASTAQEAAAQIEQQNYCIHHVHKEKQAASLPNNLEGLQRAYEEGIKIDWESVYRSLACRFAKVNLPLYEFVREEHWFGAKDKIKDGLLPKDWGFQTLWQEQALDRQKPRVVGNNWLFIGPETWVADFSGQGINIIREQDDCPLTALDGVLFAEALHEAPLPVDAAIDFQQQTVKKLLTLLKKLHAAQIKLQLIVLTVHGIPELAVTEFNASNSALVGFCKTLVLELPQFNTILIDVDKMQKDDVRHVMDEIRHNYDNQYEHLVAYRSGQRLVARLKSKKIIEIKRLLDRDSRYLISGGCGGLGLITAQALLSAGARHVILLSRDVEKKGLQETIKKIQYYYPGASIQTISLDITDKEKLAQLLAELNQDGLLKGIIHAAGAAIKASVLEHDEKDVDYLFSAKVKGGWYLHELTKHYDLDFFVVYSSISSVFGSNKESVYGAANSSLDALIATRHLLGLPGTAIQWGPWGEVGMAQKRSRDPSVRHALINNQQGHTFVKILINGEFKHTAIISPDYLKFMLDFVPKPEPAFHKQLTNDLTAIASSFVPQNLSGWLAQYVAIPAAGHLNACKDMISAICKDILELSEAEELDEEDGFFELGFDSLMITELAAELKKKLQPYLKVTVSIGFDYPSIHKLSVYIQTELDKHLPQMQTQIATADQQEDAIAIIGMSCSLPNAPDIAAFEALLEQGLSGIKDIPLTRWDNGKYYDADIEAPGKSYVSKMGLLENIKEFDADFFGISPREAKLMEPQQRLFLEGCYLALENANYPAESVRGSLTGVFAGVGPNEYYTQLEKSGFSTEELSAYSITGNVLNLIPGRVAYTFDLKGPSLSVDTACSSSLVAIHYACQSLKNREIDYALAGGVNVLLLPESNITLCKARALSPEGLCKTFDERADGYVRAEGYGVLFLKRLADALRDKDQILAVIKASAVNNDGKTAGLTVPNGKSQEAVMRKALQHAGLAQDEISFIEAHGTGTPLGDPIEVQAINEVYGKQRSPDKPLYLGTVKTNIGHLESAAGVAGVIKAVVSLRNNKIYKHLNFSKLNPNIQLHEARIPLQTIDWASASKCAAVNAFGFSGTNAHLILQAAPVGKPRKRAAVPAKQQVLLLSAKSEAALANLSKRYQLFLQESSHDFGDICFTAATCRDHYAYRLALMAENSQTASQLLAAGKFAASYMENNKLEIPDNPALAALLNAYLKGDAVDWSSYYHTQENDFTKVLLPNYVFQRTEIWLDKKEEIASIPQIHPLLGQMLSLPHDEYLFNQQLNLQHLNYIKQHCVFDKMIFPASAYIEASLAAARRIFKRNAFTLEKFFIERPLYPKENQDFQLQVKPKHDGGYQIHIFARQDGAWQNFSTLDIKNHLPVSQASVNMDDLKASFGTPVNVQEIYENFRQRSLFYGEEFQVLQQGYVHDNKVLAKVSLTQHSQNAGYYYHPVALDGAMQSILLLGMNAEVTTPYVPFAFTRMAVYQEAPRTVWVEVIRLNTVVANELHVNLNFYDNSGLLLGYIEELKLRAVTRNHFIAYESLLQNLYHIKWNQIEFNFNLKEKLPEFLVISKDRKKATYLLGDTNHQFLEELDEISLQGKNLIFFYEQSQFQDLFNCCKTLFKSPANSFTLITEHAYAIHARDEVNPYHTMASSFWKSFRNELELTKNFHIDLSENSALLPALQYVFTNHALDDQVAVRDAVYVPRLKKKQLSVTHSAPAKIFADNACYLLVGGTGGLGMAMINYLMQRGVKRIVVTSRSSCPVELQVLIERAREKNIFIKHAQADVANYQEMEKLIGNLNQAGSLKGVIHLAGIIHDGLIVNLGVQQLEQVLSAKRDGALILHQLTKHLALDLFVLFSSTASLLGARGQANYAAANGFLDGLVYMRQRQGLPGLVINWGPFAHVGMTANLVPALQKRGFIPLQQEQMDILDVLLSQPIVQISPCLLHWESYLKQTPKPAFFADVAQHIPAATPYFLNVLRTLPKKDRIKILSEALEEISADVLELEDMKSLTKKDLFALGLDSLMAIEIRNRIHDKLQCKGLSLSIEYFINEPNTDKIARYIAHELERFIQAPTHEVQQNTNSGLPVCDFQFLFWAFKKLKYNFNLGLQVQLQGKLNPDFLKLALETVIKRHEVFWLGFDAQVPVQALQKTGKFQLIFKDISLSHVPDACHKEFYHNLMQPVLFSKPPLINVFLYKINPSLHELQVIMPHIIVDDASCEIVFNEVKAVYAELVGGKEPHLPDMQKGYFDYVQENNRQYEANLAEKVHFWQRYNQNFKKLYFGEHAHLADATRQTKNLFHYPLPHEMMEKFINWHQHHNLNVSTGLIAACQIAFYKLSGQNNIPIILIHSGREGSQYKSVLGLFSEYKRINISVKDEDTFLDCIKCIENELIKAAPYQKCPHLIKDKGLADFHFSLMEYIVFKWQQVRWKHAFVKNNINATLTDYYFKYLSHLSVDKKFINLKYKLNRWFNWNIPLQKPRSLRTLISITPSFFTKEVESAQFGDLNYTFPNHFSCVDRPIGNETLWIYFSKSFKGEYLFSINAPLTTACKDQLAAEFNQVIAKFLKNESLSIEELLHE
ncbi:SDR family NAD(P)-dependent oxidoreductase [Legionella septentrionalis]|uniref:SDR family NAD(P)-dependent oxidoreductase n=1 Tax=Legionella septentrionalis TaxID=2498109 RepID=UPI000F8C7EBB|nr:SDR family NAD(P)-dependent oxidoreductase [Legionella septentrionalis]RUR17124.1 SDR family NAD(P)-dependent oxidoreductase [Legionella septentrionalis]